MTLAQKISIVAVAVLFAGVGTTILEPDLGEGAAGVLYLGERSCTGVAQQPADDLRCGIQMALRGARLPYIDGEAAARLQSFAMTRVQTLDLSSCPPGYSAEAGRLCRVHEGSAQGFTLHNSLQASLGVLQVEALLEPDGVLRGSRRVWLLSASANETRLVENIDQPRKSVVNLRPEQGAELRLSRQPPPQLSVPLADDVRTRVVATSPADGQVRVNLEWRTTPTSFWRNVRLTSISGPLAAPEQTRFSWLGQEHTPAHGTIRVEAADLEATEVAPACNGNCFKIAFSASAAVITTEGATLVGKPAVWRRRFETFAAICGLLVAIVALFIA